MHWLHVPCAPRDVRVCVSACKVKASRGNATLALESAHAVLNTLQEEYMSIVAAFTVLIAM